LIRILSIFKHPPEFSRFSATLCLLLVRSSHPAGTKAANQQKGGDRMAFREKGKIHEKITEII
jgi:hypothetical protein